MIHHSLYQPLEQFVPFYNMSLAYLCTYLVLNKYTLFVFLVFLVLAILIFCINNYNNNILYNLHKVLNFLSIEFLNIMSFQFLFLITLYYTIFLFIYTFNLLGLLPNTPCLTTQFFINILISFTLIIGVTLLNLDKNGMLFFTLFIPNDVPNLLKPLLFCLEFLSYFIRILSLSIRLFSNMVAGHSLLHILFDMSLNIRTFLENSFDIFIFVFSVIFFILVVIFFFEFIVAFLQAYVFAVMFSIYLNDLNLTH